MMTPKLNAETVDVAIAAARSNVSELIRVAIDACDSFDAEENHGSPHAKRVMDALRLAAEKTAAPTLIPPQPAPQRPRIICLCGSTKFIEIFAVKTWELELEGFIVLGCTLLPSWYCPVRDHFAESLGVKEQRDNHHLQKIDLADEILVLNVGGYVGESTRAEIKYAEKAGKTITYLEPLLAAPPSQETPK